MCLKTPFGQAQFVDITHYMVVYQFQTGLDKMCHDLGECVIFGLEEAQDKISVPGGSPAPGGSSGLQERQRRAVARLYEVVKR